MAQLVKHPVLLKLWLQLRFDHWSRNFYMPQGIQKRRRRRR